MKKNLTMDALAASNWSLTIRSVDNPRRVLSISPLRNAREPQLHVRTISRKPRIVEIIWPLRPGSANRLAKYVIDEDPTIIADWQELSVVREEKKIFVMGHSS